MEIKNFYVFLKRYKWLLIIVPVIAVLATVFMVRKMPNVYQSQTQIVTGIVDQTQQVLESQDDNGRSTRNNEQFLNMMETLHLDKVLDQVSFRLFIHDLSGKKPFRDHDDKLSSLSSADKNRIVSILNSKQAAFETLNLNVPNEKFIDSLIRLVGYDHKTLLEHNLVMYHSDGSDFITINAETGNPDLSAFIVNNLSGVFINYYTGNVNEGHTKSTSFLAKLLAEKKHSMDAKIAALQQFKVKNNILDMDNESKGVYAQLTELETRKQQADKDVIAYGGALKAIKDRFNPKDRQYVEASSTKINGSILTTRERLRAMNDKYIQNNFDSRYKKSVDSLQDALNEQINESTDHVISNPLAAKDNLVQEKLKMENELELAKYSSNSLSRQLGGLKGKLNGLVPSQATVQSSEREVEVATKEYLDVLDKYNQTNISTSVPVKLRQLQAAMPGNLQPSKKMLLVAMSGISSFIFVLVILLGVFYFDNSIRNSEDLEQKTQIAVIGHLNNVPGITSGHKQVKSKSGNERDIQVFRDLLRAVRFEIDNNFKGGKVLAVTSLDGDEGKTLVSFSLAYAYAMINKKVLLIDGNFTNPAISGTVKFREYLEDYFSVDEQMPVEHFGTEQVTIRNKSVGLMEFNAKTPIGDTLQKLQITNNGLSQSPVSILSNKGNNVSLLEIANQNNIESRLNELKEQFDVIIVEAGSLSTFNKSKEWILFADKVVGVFANNHQIKGSDKRSIKYLQELNGKMLGWIFNKLPVNYAGSEL
jgi:succinoglycan biosynthesis transport protein ExoP